jgi:cytochrome c oxidase subunit 3
VAWAVEIFGAEARKLCLTLLAGAIVLGLVFIVLKGAEYKSEYDEHPVPGIDFAFDGPLANGVQLFFVFYFIATAIRALHMIVGIGILLTLAMLIRKSTDPRHRAALHSAALYSHFVDVVWIFLFALIYLPGRSIA